MLSAADAMTWYAGIAGQTPAELTAVFDGLLGDPSGVTFLPYLSGERTPHNDADVRGAFVGLAHTHDTAALTHAVMEGVCHGLRDGLDAMTATGTTVDHLVAVGGGSNSPYWLQMLATVLDTPIVLPADADVGAAIGAARLGRLAATGESVTDVATPVEASATIDPDPDRRGAYADAGATFRSLYPAITGATS